MNKNQNVTIVQYRIFRLCSTKRFGNLGSRVRTTKKFEIQTKNESKNMAKNSMFGVYILAFFLFHRDHLLLLKNNNQDDEDEDDKKKKTTKEKKNVGSAWCSAGSLDSTSDE
jgi:hypothetical protein